MEDEKLKYNKGDLFKWDEYTSNYNACVGNNGGPHTYGDYCRGYFFAAKTLAEKVVTERSNLDISIYPMFYLYRHAIELGLKSAWVANSYVDSGKRGIISGHDLNKIWKKLKSKLIVIEEIENETISIMDKIINDVCEFDHSAEEFRFPESLSQELYLQDKSHINILALFKTMEVAENIVEYWLYSFNRILDKKEN